MKKKISILICSIMLFASIPVSSVIVHADDPLENDITEYGTPGEDYVSGEIKLQEEEIAKGGWFHRENLPAIPEKLSIARMLIDNWLN